MSTIKTIKSTGHICLKVLEQVRHIHKIISFHCFVIFIARLNSKQESRKLYSDPIQLPQQDNIGTKPKYLPVFGSKNTPSSRAICRLSYNSVVNVSLSVQPKIGRNPIIQSFQHCSERHRKYYYKNNRTHRHTY